MRKGFIILPVLIAGAAMLGWFAWECKWGYLKTTISPTNQVTRAVQ